MNQILSVIIPAFNAEKYLEEAVCSILEGRPIVVMMHYPPLTAAERETLFTELLEQRSVHTVLYGHLHGGGISLGFNGMHHGIRYRLVSCDSIGFCPVAIPLGPEE